MTCVGDIEQHKIFEVKNLFVLHTGLFNEFYEYNVIFKLRKNNIFP